MRPIVLTIVIMVLSYPLIKWIQKYAPWLLGR
jgi:hypothetical protein